MDDPDAIASPWDVLRRSQSPLHPRFRRLEGEPPAGLPHGFALGAPIAPGNDWSVFAEEANARGLVAADHRVLIVYAPATQQGADDFAASLDAQIFAGKVTLVLRRAASAAELQAADTVVYLAGRCVLDPLALERICRMTRISRLIAMPIVAAAARPDRTVSVPATIADWPAGEPWREVRGLNIAVSAALARSVGSPGADFAFRCNQYGAYFVPVFVPELVATGPVPERTGPRISVVVAAEGSAWAAGRSIARVLSQNESGVEVCLWVKGGVAKLWATALKWRYTSVRVVDAAELGDAIAATNGEFVGVLDAGDTLGPDDLSEALTRFARADLAAIRIREASGEGKAQKSWTRPSSDRLLAMGDTSGFVLLRRAAWARLGSADRAGLFDALSGIGLVETTRSTRFRRMRLRRQRPAEQSRRIEAELERRRLDRYWAAGKTEGDKVAHKSGKRLVIFWPDYSRDNAYQRLLYGPAQDDTEYVGGDVDAAIGAARNLGGERTVFHIHWTNPIFRSSDEDAAVRAEADAFLGKLAEFKQLGGSIVWTVHNVASHGSRHIAAEIAFAEALVALADRVHVHAQRSTPEIEAHFAIPPEKVRIMRHGNYLGAYADYIPRALARRELGFDDADDVLLFTGSLRSYKGLATLIAAFRQLLPAYPGLRLVLAGDAKGSDTPLLDGLSDAEAARITLVDRFLDNDELQLYLRAADAGVYPYDQVLTSGSILLALSFGLPIIAPRFGMISEAVDGSPAGFLYDRADPGGLAAAIGRMLEGKRDGRELGSAARAAADRQAWERFDAKILP
jgi:glycosyltransferase involved in cell wall biosynthesis